jgi:gas vesicle protein
VRLLLGFILGLCVGAAVVLLVVPQPGNIMRQLVVYQARERWRAWQERQADNP